MHGLYLVTPNWDDTERLLAATAAGLRGGARLVQYRNKDADAALRLEQGAALLALCRHHQVPLVINDYLDLCLALGADGVHLGGGDGDLAYARQVLGPRKIVGASCYGNVTLAIAAERAGASYAALGGFYPSPVKQYDFVTHPDVPLIAATMPAPRATSGAARAGVMPPITTKIGRASCRERV